MKRTSRAAAFLLCLLFAGSATATNLWTHVGTINDAVDGWFYSGTQFVGVRMAPTLTLYCYTVGAKCTKHTSSLSPLAIGCDANGVFYVVTRTQQEGYNVYAARLWRSTNADNWQDMGEIVAFYGIIPSGAEIVGSRSNLLVKLHNIWGEGTHRGSPPQPLFVADLPNPTNFTQVPQGDGTASIRWTGTRFVANRDNMAAASLTGAEWTPLFSLGNAYPPAKIVATWQSLFFVKGYFSGLTIQNEITGSLVLDAPTIFHDLMHPLVGAVYNGKDLVLASSDGSYVSTNYCQTWETNQLTSVLGVAYDGTNFILGDRVGAQFQAFRFTPSPAPDVATEYQPLRMDVMHRMEIVPYGTNSHTDARLFLDGCSNQLLQVEVSRDLQEWHLYGLPTTNMPVAVDVSDTNSASLFFRLGAVAAP